MFEEVPPEWLVGVYISETFLQNEAHRQKLSGIAYEVVKDEVFVRMSDTKTPQGILGILRQPSYGLQDLLQGERTLLLVLENIQDPGNLGTMLRTSEGAGVTGVIMNGGCADIFMPKAVRATMGSIFRMPFYVAQDFRQTLLELKQQEITLYAAHLKGSFDYDSFPYAGGTAFLVGREGGGLTDEAAALADAYVRIPMAGKLESLNAAMAAGILMYEASRQRRLSGSSSDHAMASIIVGAY